MSVTGETPSPSHEPPKRSTVLLLLSDIADTSWRMFLPTVSFIGLGLWIDTRWDTKPWLTLLGTIVGITITTLLIRRQFKKVNN